MSVDQALQQRRWIPTVATLPVIERILRVNQNVAACELPDGRVVLRSYSAILTYYTPETLTIQ